MANLSDDVAARYGETLRTADEIQGVAAAFIEQTCSELDDLVRRVKKYLDEEDVIDDYTLQRLAIRIPATLYSVSTGLVRATLEAQVAALLVDSLYNNQFVAMDASVAERKAEAEIYTESAQKAAAIVKHIERTIKTKMDAAQSLYEGIKKIMTARDMERQVLGSESKRSR